MSTQGVSSWRRPEGKTLEFKRSLSSPEGILQTYASNPASLLIHAAKWKGTKSVARASGRVSDPMDLSSRVR